MSLEKLENLRLKIDTSSNGEYRTQLLVEHYTLTKNMIATQMLIERPNAVKADRSGVRDIELINTYDNKRCAYGSRCKHPKGRGIAIGDAAIWLPKDSVPGSIMFHVECFEKWMSE